MNAKKAKLYHTFSELAEEYGKDLSHIGKMIKKFKLVTTPALSEGKACQSLSNEEKAKLEKKNPLLVVPKIGTDEVTVLSLAEKRGCGTSDVLKLLKRNNFKIEKRQRDGGGRPIDVLSSKEAARFNKEHPVRVKV